MLKLVIVTVLLGAAYSADVGKCLTTGADKKVASAACEAGVEKCKGPTYDILKGVGTQEYGCGPCVAADKENARMCKDCDTADCNKEVGKAGTEFMCEKYEFKEADKKFTAAADKTQCFGLDGVANICNKPGAEAKAAADYNIQNSGCGACVAKEKTDKKCEEVAGAAGLTAFLLPLLAALYTLF